MDGVQTYIAAQIKVLEIEQKIRELAEAGKHKVKNKIISEQLRKATSAKNKALRAIIASMNAKAAREIAQGTGK
jgi:hypothetical protein